MSWFGTIWNLADFAAGTARSNAPTRQRANAPTKLYQHTISLVGETTHRGLLLPVCGSASNRLHSMLPAAPRILRAPVALLLNCSIFTFLGAAQRLRIPNCSPVQLLYFHLSRRSRGGCMLKRICSVFAFPAAARLLGLSAFVAFLSVPAQAMAATAKGSNLKPTKPSIKSDEIPLNCPAKFITALLVGLRGGIWAAGEDTGIYYLKAGGHAWKHFDKANSPGLVSNSIYSLCMDHRGRLWAGTNRHGVCVFNGQEWQPAGRPTGMTMAKRTPPLSKARTCGFAYISKIPASIA